MSAATPAHPARPLISSQNGWAGSTSAAGARSFTSEMILITREMYRAVLSDGPCLMSNKFSAAVLAVFVVPYIQMNALLKSSQSAGSYPSVGKASNHTMASPLNVL